MQERLKTIFEEAKEQLKHAGSLQEAEDVRIKVLGKKGQLTEILQEEAAGYFAGSMTAEQAARNIQSRASLYLQEHRRA